MEAEATKKRKRKPGGGRKKLWNEGTKTLSVVVPISKVESFMQAVTIIKRQWINEAKKVS